MYNIVPGHIVCILNEKTKNIRLNNTTFKLVCKTHQPLYKSPFKYFNSMYGLMFSMQITVMAMARDSLLPKSFDGDKPVIEILGVCLIAGVLAGLFRMEHLIDMLSIGIIFAFMAMAFAVVMFR